MNSQIKFVLWEAMIATMYVTLVFVFQFMSFGQVQFRIAEALLIFALFNPKHAVGLTIGTFVANFLFSSLGIIDPIIGTLATLIALSFMILFRKKPLIALLFPVISNALLVSWMLYYVLDMPYFISLLWVALGEGAVVYGIGYPLYRTIIKNEYIKSIMES